MSNKKQDPGPHKKFSLNPQTSDSVPMEDVSSKPLLSDRSQRRRPVSPVPSGVSIKSDQSKFDPPNLGSEPQRSDLKPKSQKHRPVSPVPSGVSIKSDQSKFDPPNLGSEPQRSDLKSRSQRRRPVSPVPSGVSMKSDQSKFDPPNLSREPQQSDLSVSPSRSRSQRCRPVSPVPSGVSMKSEQSKFDPPNLRSEPLQSGLRKRRSSHSHEPGNLLEEPPNTKRSRQIQTGDLRSVLVSYKANLKRRFEGISEGIIQPGTENLLDKIYTELYITEGESEGVNKEHEVWQVESASRAQTAEEIQIHRNDIFKPLPGQEKHIRTVMTKGIAGIGKTVSVQKFILDWIDGVANQNVDFMFPFSFRELNLVSGDQYSLHKLLLDFHPELKCLKDDEYKNCKVVFIFDGLDESRILLNFSLKLLVSDVKQASSVEVLITNLIQGTLFPSALIWITSRPAAAGQIPPQYIDQITEIRGFSDLQKEEYFRKRISDESQANEIISHIKAFKSLHIMCHIPVFCWIAATVLQEMLEQDNTQKIPKTLTEMFIHFLLIQLTRRSQKHQAKSDQEMQITLESQKGFISKLSELAFRHLERQNFIFLEEEVRECGLDVTDAVVHSGLCTDVFTEETFLFGKMYTFVHLTIQEFLAALYTFASYINKNEEVLKLFLKEKSSISPEDMSLDELLKNAVNRALESKNGHLDLFVRFLHGISMESNQILLEGFLTCTDINPESIEKAIKNLKELNRPNISPDRWINLLHCQVEMHDSTVLEEVLTYIKNAEEDTQKLKLTYCSAVAKILQMSEKPLEELDLMKFKTSDEGRRRLIPAVRNCRKALIAGCKLTEKSCEVVASALESAHSHLILLDLSNNDLQKSEEKLFRALESQHCKLESLSLAGCKLTAASCQALALVLQTEHSHLNELDLSLNPLEDSGIQHLSSGLKSPHCSLQKLRLSGCNITGKGCEFLASALEDKSCLTDLHLKDNRLKEEDVKPLSRIKEDPKFVLKIFEYS